MRGPRRTRVVPTGDRRRFLGMAGAGVAVAGAGSLVPEPLGDTGPPWEVDVKEGYDAVGDGAADDSPAFQAAFSALGAEPGRIGPPQGITGARLLVPPGDYVLRSTVRIHRFAGIVQGSGVGMGPVPQGEVATGLGTVFRWEGPSGEPMFEITDSRFLQVRDLRFLGRDEGPPAAGLRFLKERPEDNQGSNGELLVSDCYFGTWPWTGTDRGLLAGGIEFAGDVGDNDQFRIVRCHFKGEEGVETFGIRIGSTQSVWGSVTDCTFNRLGTGFETLASSTMVNPQFNRCATDLHVRSTARLEVIGWQSEHSGRLARLEGPATLQVTGGACQVDGSTMAPGRALIDAHPSANHQTIALDGLLFSYPASEEYPDGLAGEDGRPDIRFGPAPNTATSSGFYVRVHDCLGLIPSQCTLVDPLVGGSRGTVEWYSRAAGVHQFRNELRGSGAPGTRRSLDRGAWDPPVPGTS